MSRKQKILLGVLVAFVLTILGRLFLNAPIAHIQFAAEPVGRQIFGKWDLTNSLIAAWVAMGLLIVLSVLATRKLAIVPRGLYNFVEAVIEWFRGIVHDIAGRENGRKFFPLVATLFLFILVANWTALVPVFGTIGKVERAEFLLKHGLEEAIDELNENLPKDARLEAASYYEDEHAEHDSGVTPAKPEPEVVAAVRKEIGDDRLAIFNKTGGALILPVGYKVVKEIRFEEYWDFDQWEARTGVVDSGEEEVDLEGKTVGILVPYLRNMNTDLMNPLAMALIAMIMVEYWGIKANGFRSYASRFINLKEGPIGFAVGILESISEFAKVISFSFRLLGNMFAGEILIFAFLFLLPIMAGVLVLPFLLETFVGFIQAVIFAALTLVFATLAVESHAEGEGSGGHGS